MSKLVRYTVDMLHFLMSEDLFENCLESVENYSSRVFTSNVLIITISYLFIRSDFLTTASRGPGAMRRPNCHCPVCGPIKKHFKLTFELQEEWRAVHLTIFRE